MGSLPGVELVKRCGIIIFCLEGDIVNAVKRFVATNKDLSPVGFLVHHFHVVIQFINFVGFGRFIGHKTLSQIVLLVLVDP